MVITKPVSRSAVVFSKLIAQNVIILGSTIMGAFACYFYTVLLFHKGKLLEFSQAFLLILVYYFLIISISLFFSSILNNQIGAGGLTLLSLIILYFIPYLSNKLEKYILSGLTTSVMEIMKGENSLSQSIWPIITSLIISIGLIFLGCLIFNRQEL